MHFILLHSFIFVPIPNNCTFQITGIPLSEYIYRYKKDLTIKRKIVKRYISDLLCCSKNRYRRHRVRKHKKKILKMKLKNKKKLNYSVNKIKNKDKGSSKSLKKDDKKKKKKEKEKKKKVNVAKEKDDKKIKDKKVIHKKVEVERVTSTFSIETNENIVVGMETEKTVPITIETQTKPVTMETEKKKDPRLSMWRRRKLQKKINKEKELSK